MDQEPRGKVRKVRFAPKAPPPRRDQKPILPKVEKVEAADADAAKAQELLRRFNEAKTKPKAEKKPTHVRVSFGYGAESSLRSYGTPKSGVKSECEEYKEPWDYYTYYPVTLPLRRPYSGNPELLDEEEFGETSESITFDEASINSAVELDLMEENLEASMMFLQLPENMPLTKQIANKEGQGMAKTSEPSANSGPSGKPCGLYELPAGFMGKMLVYKSGEVKMKLGDVLYDVSAGLDSVFAQDAVAINTEEKHCCIVGELNKCAIVTPNIDSILDNISDL